MAATALTAAASGAAVSGSPDLRAPTATATQHRAGSGPATLVAVRTGRHLDYDRVVFDLTGSAPGWTVGYAPRLVEDASGRPMPLRGRAILRVVLTGVQAHDEHGSTTVRTPSTLTPELPTLRQVRLAGDFEAVLSEGLGLRDRVGFRVFGLSHPTRVVVDVAHQPRQPFGSAPVVRTGTAADAVVSGVRAGQHPGYDRVVFDLAGSAQPSVRVAGAPYGSAIEVSVLGIGSASQAPHAAYRGPTPMMIGLPAIRRLDLTSAGAGRLVLRLTTGASHGFRVMTLGDPTRLAVDVAH